MYSLPTSTTLAALTIASAASTEPIRPRVSTMPSASDAMCSGTLAELRSIIPLSMPHLKRRIRACAVACALLAAACGRTQQPETPVATATVTLARADAAIGMPIEMSYRFVVAQNAPTIGENETVFVHFLDTERELMWTDDHQPTVPTSQWKPGQTIEYTRTMFVPKFPYAGDTSVVIGVYSPKSGARVPLSGPSRGQREYELAKFNLHPQADNLYVGFKDGWHETEVAEEQPGVEWKWSKKTATLVFRNPMRDALFSLQCDQPVQGLGDPQRIELRSEEHT